MSEINRESESLKSSVSMVGLMNLAAEMQEKYPEAMNILDITGVSPFGSREMMNPYTGEADLEDFSNVGRHCVAVAYAAQKMADALGVSQEQKDEIIKSAILHDGDKRVEVMRKKAKKAGVEIDVYGEEGYKTIETIFSDSGVDPHIFATIQSMGGVTGHNSLRKFLIVKNGELQLNPERTLTEIIVHIADDMTHSASGEDGEVTQYVSFEKRAELSKFSEKYSFLWQEGFGISEETGIQEIKVLTQYQGDTVKNFYDWQKLVFQMICDHLQKQVDSTNSRDSVEFLIDIISKNSIGTISDISEKIDQNLRVK